MSGSTPSGPTPEAMAMLALDAVDQFGGDLAGLFGGRCYDNGDDKVVDLLAALRHLADVRGCSWPALLAAADRLYAKDKAFARESKPR